MLSVCLTKIRLLCCQFPSGDEANSVNCLHGVQDKAFLNRSFGNVTQTTSSRSGLQTDYSHMWARQSRFLHRVSFLPILALCFLSCSEIILVSFSLFLYFSFLFLLFYVIIIFYKIILLLLYYYNFFFMTIIFIFSCSGMFRNVPACSGMFRVPD